MNDIRTLSDSMRERFQSGEPSYVLFLGLTPSTQAGVPEREVLVDGILRTGGSSLEGTSEMEKAYACYRYLADQSDPERYTILGKLSGYAVPSSGYRHLAALIRAGYLDIIFTKGWDTLLEDALSDAGMRIRRDFSVVFLGSDCELLIDEDVDKEHPRIRIIKLPGDPPYPLPPSRTDAQAFGGILEDYLNRDLIMVGCTLRDEEVDNFWIKLLERNIKRLFWYVDSGLQPMSGAVGGLLTACRGNLITGQYGQFDSFFGKLADMLVYQPEHTTVSQTIGSVEEGSSVVGIEIGTISGGSVAVGEPIAFEELRMVEAQPSDKSRWDEIDSLVRQSRALRQTLHVLQEQSAIHGESSSLRLMRDIRRTEAELLMSTEQIKRLMQETSQDG
jgi:hypothetical protein